MTKQELRKLKVMIKELQSEKTKLDSKSEKLRIKIHELEDILEIEKVRYQENNIRN